MRRGCAAFLRIRLIAATVAACFVLGSCHREENYQVVVGSKFFTEQIILAELLAQHIEARTGLSVGRKTNLGGTLLVQEALLAGQLDMYVEYTGTALTAVLGEKPDMANENEPAAEISRNIYERVRRGYAQRFQLAVLQPLGFENTFAMVVRGEDAARYHLKTISDIVPLAPHWKIGVGYEFQERPDGFRGWSERYGLRFAESPSVMDLGLIYRALLQKQVDIVAGNSTDGLIDKLHLVALQDDKHYFPPYDAVPIVRDSTLQKYPQLRAVIDELGGKISAADIRKMNYEVDANLRDPATVVREFRQQRGL